MPHATPAAWSAHASSRSFKDFIAQQQIEADPPLDVMMGGGRRHFDRRRADGRDLLEEHASRHTLVSSAEELREAVQGLARDGREPPKPLIGLFSDEDLNYEVDRLHQPRTGI
jgi:alkaline phosphatase